MANRNKFEEMLERLVNEDKAGAEELFHEIVVEKSRDIYESLLEDDLDIEEETDEEVEEASDEEVEEATDEEVEESDDEEVDENFDLDEFEVEADPMDMGGDPADDMMGDLEGGDEEGEEGEEDEGEEGDMEDRVEDLEDALEDLKAEFEKMMAGDDDGEEDSGDMDDMDDGEEEAEEESLYFGEAEDEDDDDEEVEEASDEEVEEGEKSATEQMREYVEKVAGGHGAETKGKGETADNKKSPVAGKNDMGGTASNIVAGGEGSEAGPKGGLGDDNAKEENAGNVNVPGGKASKSMKAEPKGHGAEKKGAGETAANKKSTIGS